ncbi:MAG TPA: response regulator transcription factor [Gammaproteobacteria bacterium]|nr:response regulator transcription factor [Gammaproteobacteria bacterium]
MRCRVLLADDHQIVREGLRGLLEKAGHEVVAEAADGREVLRLARTLSPDIAVLDMSMPLLNGLDAAYEIQRIAPNVKTILLTMYNDKSYVLRALREGVRGYVLKSQASVDLIHAIQEIMRGDVYISPGVAATVVDAYLGKIDVEADPLTPRERQILQLVAEGKTTKEIATLLNVSFKTAESHRNRIMKKLNIHNVTGLVHYAIRSGLMRL